MLVCPPIVISLRLLLSTSGPMRKSHHRHQTSSPVSGWRRDKRGEGDGRGRDEGREEIEETHTVRTDDKSKTLKGECVRKCTIVCQKQCSKVEHTQLTSHFTPPHHASHHAG